jgi:hypothetical protein
MTGRALSLLARPSRGGCSSLVSRPAPQSNGSGSRSLCGWRKSPDIDLTAVSPRNRRATCACRSFVAHAHHPTSPLTLQAPITAAACWTGSAQEPGGFCPVP